MKKVIALFLSWITALLCFFAVGCGKEDTLKIGYLTGPTGMGMAKLITDQTDADGYVFTAYSDVQAIQSALLAGDVDLACFPTNTAAALAKATDNITVLAVNTLGSLYIVSDEAHPIASVADLEGQTIYASVPNSTTGAILNEILSLYGVKANVSFSYRTSQGSEESLATHDMLVSALLQGDVGIAVLPEPKVSAAVIRASSLKEPKKLSVSLNLSELWSEKSDAPLAMGCLIGRSDFVRKNEKTVSDFLVKYRDSVEFIANKSNFEVSCQSIVKAGVIPQLPIAKAALNNLYGSVVYLDGDEMQKAMDGFLKVIGEEVNDEIYFR